MPTTIETTDQYDAAERLLEKSMGQNMHSSALTVAEAQVHATLAVADRLEALTERLESILDAGLSGIRDQIEGA